VSIRKQAPDPDNAKVITTLLRGPANRGVSATAAAIRALGFSAEISDTVVTEEGVCGNDPGTKPLLSARSRLAAHKTAVIIDSQFYAVAGLRAAVVFADTRTR
jgi:hypothetical protein